MFSRSLNYNSGSYQPNNYANIQPFNADTVNFPTVSPYSFSNHASYAYPSVYQPNQN